MRNLPVPEVNLYLKIDKQKDLLLINEELRLNKK